jgi:hypothetical protein
MKKAVVLSFFALGSVYFVACNKESLSPDSMSSDAVSAATAADSTHKHKGPHGDSLGVKPPKGMPHDSLGHKPPKDSLGVKPPKLDSLTHKPKKAGPKKG